ncbi:MAG: serine protease [Proteobacteria bacterium]|nr:serine protease [Pseudomonadota bacterium]
MKLKVLHATSLKKLQLLLTGIVLIVSNIPVCAESAKTLFSEYSNRIYQLRIIELSSGKQAALGSGFQISADGLVISNFHVISDYVHHPERYRVECVSHEGNKAELNLINIDVVNDLSLLKIANAPSAYLKLATSLPEHGESIYSIGNPRDLGLTVVPDTYNGITAYSAYERIHFSGSINPGMSGGPVLNENGEVVGVNVSTYGDQVSFLVSLHRLAAFVEKSAQSPIDLSMLETVIAMQLHANQRELIGNLVRGEWMASEFGGATVPNEIADHIRCWGYSDDNPEIRYSHTTSYCREDEHIYLSSGFFTGNILYQFDWYETEELNRFQFYNMFKAEIENAGPDNYARKEDVHNYKCYDDFIKSKPEQAAEVVTKATYCAREYKKYPGLYDVLYLGASVHENKKGLISHFTLAGVSQDMALQFTKKFISSIKWN